MVKRPTWILLAILVLVIGAYFLIKAHPLQKPEATPTVAANSFLINQSEGALQSLQIIDAKGAKVQMQRDLSKTWVVTAPLSMAADQALASEAETQVGALKIVTSLDSPPDPSSIGLSIPAYTMELNFVDGANHKLEIGNLTPTSSGYYVRFDNEKVYIISQSGIDALLNLLKAPPYPATETPTPAGASLDTPTAEVTTPIP
jgi:hypothetical protein